MAKAIGSKELASTVRAVSGETNKKRGMYRKAKTSMTVGTGEGAAEEVRVRARPNIVKTQDEDSDQLQVN